MANQVFQRFSPFFDLLLAHPRDMEKTNYVNTMIQHWGKKRAILNNMQTFPFPWL